MSNPNSSQPQGQGARDGRDGNDSRDSRDNVPNPLQPAPPEVELQPNPTYGDDLLHRQFPTRTYYYSIVGFILGAISSVVSCVPRLFEG
jgi:hypothetical protein